MIFYCVMTIQLPTKSTGDHILKMLGRKRAVYCRANYKALGPYAYFGTRKEPFLLALFSRRDRVLKPGWLFLNDWMFDVDEQKTKEPL